MQKSMSTGSALFALRFSRLLRFSIGLLVVGSATAAYSATYYVDFAAGNDDSAGTSPTTAWKTIPGTKTSDLSGWRTLNYANGTVVAGTVKVPAGTTFKLKSGTTHDRSNGGLIFIDSTFYQQGTSNSPIVFQRDLTWGNGQIIIDGSGMTFSAWTGLFEIHSLHYVHLDGAIANGIKVQNSGYYGVFYYDKGDSGADLRNLEIYNSLHNNLLCDSSDYVTPTYMSNVTIQPLCRLGWVTRNR